MAEIALFGGSFDPPHVGHLLAAAWVLATEPVDELWFVPVHEHPLGKKMAAPFEHRVELCQLAIADLGLKRARVSRIEEDLGGEGRTVDLLEHLHQRRPGDRFALVLGTDLKLERAQWKRFERIQELARIIEVWRGGYPHAVGTRIAEPPLINPAGTRIAAPPLIMSPNVALLEISSTQIRAALSTGADISRLVPRAVLDAIRAAGTYR